MITKQTDPDYDYYQSLLLPDSPEDDDDLLERLADIFEKIIEAEKNEVPTNHYVLQTAEEGLKLIEDFLTEIYGGD